MPFHKISSAGCFDQLQLLNVKISPPRRRRKIGGAEKGDGARAGGEAEVQGTEEGGEQEEEDEEDEDEDEDGEDGEDGEDQVFFTSPLMVNDCG